MQSNCVGPATRSHAAKSLIFTARLSQILLDNVSRHIRQTKIPSRVPICEPFVIQAEAVQDCGVKIVNADCLLNDVQTQIISFSHNLPTPCSSACHPHREG